MAFLADLARGGASGILEGVGKAALDLRAAITGESVIDPNKRAEIEMRLMEIENSTALAQMAINQAEAASSSFFRGGWRPAVGWVCVFGLVYGFLIQPIVPWAVTAFKLAAVPALPALDTGTLMTLLLGMLGLGGMRSFEKQKGVTK